VLRYSASFTKEIPELLDGARTLGLEGLIGNHRLAEGARILQINMLDHVIVGQPFDRRPGYFGLQRSGCDLMKTTKALFFELMCDFQSERWNEFELPKLFLRELLTVAKLLGSPSCGSKETGCCSYRLINTRLVGRIPCKSNLHCGKVACNV
jgi:hypothetical protein